MKEEWYSLNSKAMYTTRSKMLEMTQLLHSAKAKLSKTERETSNQKAPQLSLAL